MVSYGMKYLFGYWFSCPVFLPSQLLVSLWPIPLQAGQYKKLKNWNIFIGSIWLCSVTTKTLVLSTWYFSQNPKTASYQRLWRKSTLSQLKPGQQASFLQLAMVNIGSISCYWKISQGSPEDAAFPITLCCLSLRSCLVNVYWG